jgi:hypothetical protein
MKVIAVSSLAAGRTRDELATVKERGIRAVWDLMKKGVVRRVYQRREQVGVVLELEVEDGATAMAIMSQLPAIRLGILELKELIVCDPFLSLETLFD